MGTTRIKVIDLSSQDQQIKTSRKHAEKLTGASKIKGAKEKPASTQQTESESINAKEPRPEGLESTDKIAAPKSKKVVEASVVTKPETAPSASSVVTSKQKPKHHQGKKYQEAKKLIAGKTYNVKEAIELLPKTSITRFDPAVEIHLSTLEKNLKGNINFPHPFATKQKPTRYLIFSDKLSTINDKQIIWGSEKTISDIESGKLKPGRDFDTVISSPKFMPSLAKIAKILGPRGMMPNPKNGTVTEDFEKVVSDSEKSSYQYKSDPTSPVIHAKIGKLSQKSTELEENLKALIGAIGPTKIKKGVLASSMSPSIKVDLSSIN